MNTPNKSTGGDPLLPGFEDFNPPEAAKLRHCADCNEPIPDDLLACPRCAGEKYYQGALDFARRSLPQILTGDILVRLAKPVPALRWEIALPGCSLAWCGVELKASWPERRVKFAEIPHATLCHSCLDAIWEKGMP